MLLRGTDATENRKLTAVGAGFLAAVVLAAGCLYVVTAGDSDESDRIALVIDTPYVGPGVAEGTDLILHGLPIGEVTDVSSLPEGGVRLQAFVESGYVGGLTDDFGIDFRPANYFGITAINVRPVPTGSPLRSGLVVDKIPDGNYTMQALLSQLGGVSGGVLTDRFIQVVDMATRYTDGLSPLIETALTVASAAAEVQTVSTTSLITNAAGVSAGFPIFLDGAIEATKGIVETEVATVSEDEYVNGMLASLDVISTEMFGAIGTLLRSHETELEPATEIVGVLSDALPAVVGRANLGPGTDELRARLEQMFTGSGDEPAVRVRIVLDRLPGLSAPLTQMGAAAPTEGPR